MTLRYLSSTLLLFALLSPACGDDDSGGNHNLGPYCGDGVREAQEECDGEDLDGTTCQDLSYAMGTLACGADCKFDLRECAGGGPVCGNWEAEYGEECDTNDLGGSTCEGAGFGPGTVACLSNCTLDLSGCSAPASCGNDIVEAPEQCDGPDLAGATCADRGFLSGTLRCAANCTFDETLCYDSACGNGVAESGEECDGSDLGGYDCVMLGYSGGTLACDEAICLFDDSGCQ